MGNNTTGQMVNASVTYLNEIDEENSDAQEGSESLRALLWDKTIYYLSRRDHSSKELKRKLRNFAVRKFGQSLESEMVLSLIDDCLNRARELGYLDENRFAEMLVRTRQGRGYGPARIKMELSEHQVCSDGEHFGLENGDPFWVDKIVDAILRKSRWHKLEDQVVRQKVLRHFYNKGFSQDQIYKAMVLAEESLSEQ